MQLVSTNCMQLVYIKSANRKALIMWNGVLLEYPTTTGFQWGHLKNGPYTYTVNGGNGMVF